MNFIIYLKGGMNHFKDLKMCLEQFILKGKKKIQKLLNF